MRRPHAQCDKRCPCVRETTETVSVRVGRNALHQGTFLAVLFFRTLCVTNCLIILPLYSFFNDSCCLVIRLLLRDFEDDELEFEEVSRALNALATASYDM